ncbi:MAG TPA: rhodanese-like domain-containing protein [Pseudomonadales bacterium]|nr:rhodanese-like domain-containing protein [Pseudomonadales bacterium]
MNMMKWMASGLLLFVMAAPVWAQDVPLVSQQQLLELQSSSAKPLLVDVRSADEFKQGHVPGAINIPHDQVQTRLSEFGAKDRDIILYCHSGRRSGLASQVLSAAGFSHVRHLEGDMMGWQAKQRPIEK